MRLAEIKEIQAISNCSQLLPALIQYAERQIGVPARHQSIKQRETTICMLVDLGALDLRGAVHTLSRHYGMTRTGIYGIINRHLRK